MEKIDSLAAALHALGTRFKRGFPEDHAHAEPTALVMLRARDAIEEMQTCIRKLCPEIEARKLLSFRVAEEIFSKPRRDQ